MLECCAQLIMAHHLAHANSCEVAQEIAFCDTDDRLAVGKVFCGHHDAHAQNLLAAVIGTSTFVRSASAQVPVHGCEDLGMIVQKAVNRIILGSIFTNDLLVAGKI